jgi:phage/plasmid-like protein (TIGR03299 family)
MADNINFNEQTGKHAFYSVKEAAWHGYGQIVQDYQTSEEVCRAAQLDYTVVKKPLMVVAEKRFILKDSMATVRTDNGQPLGIVGKDYEVVQNTEAFAFFDSIVGEEGGIKYETAGALGKGERIFITAKLPDHIMIGDDPIDRYLFLTNGHNGQSSVIAAFTPIRIVCQNTLNAALYNNSHKITFRHTKNVANRLKQAKTLLGLTDVITNQVESLFNELATTKIKPKVEKELVIRALDYANRYDTMRTMEDFEIVYSNKFVETVEEIMDYTHTHETQKSIAGSLYGTYNGFTGYFQNIAEYKSSESKLVSVMEGTVYNKQQRMFNLLKKELN